MSARSWWWLKFAAFCSLGAGLGCGSGLPTLTIHNASSEYPIHGVMYAECGLGFRPGISFSEVSPAPETEIEPGGSLTLELAAGCYDVTAFATHSSPMQTAGPLPPTANTVRVYLGEDAHLSWTPGH